jgi:hypothetical protein
VDGPHIRHSGENVTRVRLGEAAGLEKGSSKIASTPSKSSAKLA